MVYFKNLVILAICNISIVLLTSCRRDSINFPDDGFFLYVNTKSDCYDCICDGIKRIKNTSNFVRIIGKDMNDRFMSYVKEDFKNLKFAFYTSTGNIFPTPSIIFVKKKQPIFILFIEYDFHERLETIDAIRRILLGA